MGLIPKIDDTTADLLVSYYKSPTDVELPKHLEEIATQVSQIKQLFAEKWKKRDIVAHLIQEWGVSQKTAYDRINLATLCFPDITEAYIDMEIQLLLDYQIEAMEAFYAEDPRIFMGILKERRLLLSFLKNRTDNKATTATANTTINYIYIQNNSGLPTKVREDELPTLDIEARNLLLKKASANMIPTEFTKLLPKDEQNV